MKTDTYIKVLQGSELPKVISGEEQVVKVTN